jgi:hypothetical protein
MAWWTTHLVFRDDTLIAEGLDPLALEDVEIVTMNGAGAPHGSEHYTRVIVSGYALYGVLRGYYALGISHWYVQRAAQRVFASEASQRNIEPVASLSSTQRAVIRECLMRIDLNAWEASNRSFRQQLEDG